MELMDKEELREQLALLDEANVNYKLCVGEGGKSLPLGGTTPSLTGEGWGEAYSSLRRRRWGEVREEVLSP